MKLNIKGLDKAEVLLRLYNNSSPQGLGFLHNKCGDMLPKEAMRVIKNRGLEFDYLFGRPLKINLEGDELETGFYDRENGEGAAERVLKDLFN